jgi:hypothetical protein
VEPETPSELPDQAPAGAETPTEPVPATRHDGRPLTAADVGPLIAKELG